MERLRGGIGDSSAHDLQANTARHEHHTTLHRPENPPERRTNAP